MTLLYSARKGYLHEIKTEFSPQARPDVRRGIVLRPPQELNQMNTNRLSSICSIITIVLLAITVFLTLLKGQSVHASLSCGISPSTCSGTKRPPRAASKPNGSRPPGAKTTCSKCSEASPNKMRLPSRFPGQTAAEE